jgi:hypothetical protein
MVSLNSFFFNSSKCDYYMLLRFPYKVHLPGERIVLKITRVQYRARQKRTRTISFIVEKKSSPGSFAQGAANLFKSGPQEGHRLRRLSLRRRHLLSAITVHRACHVATEERTPSSL